MPDTPSPVASDAEVIDRVIRARRTSKLLLAPEHRAAREADWTEAHARELERMIEGAAWAPFHRRANEAAHRGGDLDSPLPWRFHVLEGRACTALIDWLERQGARHPDSKWSRARQSKIKDMLAACGALVQATWLPDPPAEAPGTAGSAGSDDRARGDGPAEPILSVANVEHVAAASAAVQNLLLAAEARGWRSYWSSGGILRDAEVFERLGIAREEALLGSVFLSPAVAEHAVERAGGLREERGEIGRWMRRVILPEG